MTIDVKALRALLDKATPGEWRAASQWARCTLDHDGRGGGHGRGACAYLAQPPEPHDHEIIVPCPAGAVLGERIIVAGTWDYEEGGIQRAEDTALIVAAVNALPDLLALAEAVRELAGPIAMLVEHGSLEERDAARRVLAILEGK